MASHTLIATGDEVDNEAVLNDLADALAPIIADYMNERYEPDVDGPSIGYVLSWESGDV